MKIAIIGTGAMGSGMAEGFLKAGHEVIVYNRTESRTEPLVALGAKAVSTPAEAINMADASILVLIDGASVRNVLLNEETLAAVNGKKILNASTTSLEDTLEIANELRKHGGSFAEAPMLAGPEQLRNREAYFMLACEANEESFWVDILSSIGPTSSRMGELGDASKVGTVVTLVSSLNIITAVYAAAAIERLNIPKEAGINALNGMIFDPTLLPKLFARNYDHYAGNVDDNIHLTDDVIEMAKKLNISSAILERMRDLYAEASKRGFGKTDGTSILEVVLQPSDN